MATQIQMSLQTSCTDVTNCSEVESDVYVDNNSLICWEFCNVNACTLQELSECVYDFIRPTCLEWFFISLHLVVFVVGVVGNFLVCFVVLRSSHMQTVTNLFIVNLAVADFVVLIFASPTSVLQAVTETWFLGETMCKITYFIQVRTRSTSPIMFRC